MAEYERSRVVQAPADDVFAFLSDVRSLPAFVPTVTAAEQRGEGRVRIRGESRGGVTYDDDGWFHIDQARRRVEWGADERTYSGWLSVSGEGDGAQVVVHLSVPPEVTASGRPITGELETWPDPIEQSLETALDSLRNLMEGTGGKEPLPAGG